MKSRLKSNSPKFSAYMSLVDKIADFAYPMTYEMDVDDYLDEFFGVSESIIYDQYITYDQEEYFWEWFWYDLRTEEDKTVIETYITEFEEDLSQDELQYLIGIQKSHRSCFEVLSVRKGIGFFVQDLLLKEKFFVREIKGTRFFKAGQIIYARLIPLKRKNVFSASFEILEQFDLSKLEKNLNIEYKLTAPELPYKEFLQIHGGILYQNLFS